MLVLQIWESTICILVESFLAYILLNCSLAHIMEQLGYNKSTGWIINPYFEPCRGVISLENAIKSMGLELPLNGISQNKMIYKEVRIITSLSIA